MSRGAFNELFWVAGMVLTGDESQLLIIAEDAVEVEVHVIDLDTLEVEQRIGMLRGGIKKKLFFFGKILKFRDPPPSFQQFGGSSF